ncbi:MAG TPA: phenylpyruvate tautomerase MIF-related protein [Candidatus Ozemobacteraceae bacterium]|nr:phenylpyruvate tautomerase MIF-related protein [Candidatus Ozemobacteraceae bacterium]
MPFLRLTSSDPGTEAKAPALSAELSQSISALLGKPEMYVMISISTSVMRMSGTDAPAAFIDLRSVGGISPQKNKILSKTLSGIVQKHLAVPADRIFLTFTDIPGASWDWNGDTFG